MITVIIPVYNVEKYLERCIRSVINQTYRNLEIILIDDGSNDSSGIICDEFARCDNRIKVIHQKNQGLSCARNTGIQNANGDWIAFLDSDDWINEKMYEVLYSVALENQAEIVSCDSVDRFDFQDEVISLKDNYQVTQYDNIDILKELIHKRNVRFEVWNKIYKRSIISDVRFIPGQVSEDVHFGRFMYTRVKRYFHISAPLHNYLINREGNTRSTFKERRFDAFEEFKQWILDYPQNSENAELVACIAMVFAIGIYNHAVEVNASKEVKKRIRTYFAFYFRAANNNESIPFKAKIFAISPKAYLTISKLKNR
jgi:glycosyltransferase involved in cell wall biosynthesis